MEPRNEEIEARIFEDPEQPSNYLVYADWLQSAGAPRGELIAAQARALDGDPDAEALVTRLLDEHREAFVGPVLDITRQPEIDWHLGFWRTLRFPGWGWSPKPLLLEHIDSMLASPSARFLRTFDADGDLEHEVLILVAQSYRTLEQLHLALRGSPINDHCLEILGECRRLRHLHLFSCQDVTSEGLGTIRGFRQLESIDLRNHPLDDDGVVQLEGLPLRSVHFNKLSGRFSPSSMLRLSRMPLVSLELIDGSLLGDDHFAPLAEHPSIAELWISRAQISARGASALGSTSLQNLVLAGSSLGDEGVARLPTTLRELVLGHSRPSLTDAACASLARMRELESLDIGSNPGISGVGIGDIASLENLHTLCLSFLDLSDQDIAVLRRLKKLARLSLYYVQALTDAAIDTLLELPLQALDLGATRITPRAIDRLQEAQKDLAALGLYGCSAEVIAHARTFDSWYVNSRDSLEL